MLSQAECTVKKTCTGLVYTTCTVIKFFIYM